jgi:hypothetical protein
MSDDDFRVSQHCNLGRFVDQQLLWYISRNDFQRWYEKLRAIWGPLYASNSFMDDLACLYSQAKSHLDGSGRNGAGARTFGLPSAHS